MRVTPRLLSLWPGLCQLWLHGRWSGLVAAALFTGFVNLAIVTTFLWPQWFTSTVPVVSWLIAAGMVTVSVWRTLRQPLESITDTPNMEEDLLPRAQVEYLRGHWFEAESLLLRLLQTNAEDVEARLMLASTYRHTRRVDDARQQLGLLRNSVGGDKWASEIESETRLLDKLNDADGNEVKLSESVENVSNAA